MNAGDNSDQDIADLTARIEARDAAKADREKMMGAQLRQAVGVLGPLIKDLPATDTYLLAPLAVDAWRTLRDGDPEGYLVYLSAIRQRCGNNIALLVANRVGQGGSSSHALTGYTTAAIWEDYEPQPYLVKKILIPTGLTVLFGQSGHLKSVTAIDLALCVGTGMAFHGIKTRRAGVLYVAGEGHAGIKKRIRAWLIANGLNSASEQPAVFVTNSGVDLIGNSHQLRATVEHAAAVLGVAIEFIIIDTLAANFGAGDENVTADMTRAIAGARAADAQAAIMLVHHTGHGQSDRERGSYSLIAAADYRIQATYDDFSKLLELKWHKSKDDEKPDPMVFQCRKIDIDWQDEDGEELTSVVIELLDGGIMPAQRSAGLGKNEQIAIKSLKALYVRNRKSLEEQGRNPEEARIMVSGWRADCERRGIQRQRWHEVIKSLTSDQLVAIEGVFVALIDGAL